MSKRRASKELTSLTGTSAHERRYQAPSQSGAWYANRQRSASPAPKPAPTVRPDEPTPRLNLAKVLRKVHPRKPTDRLVGEAAADRRSAIKYIYEKVLHSPPKEEWETLKTISTICDALHVPRGSRGVVQSVLQALADDPDYDVRREAPGKGRPAEIRDGDEQAEFIYKTLEGGNTIGVVTVLLNNCYRRPRRMKNLSYSTVARFVHKSPYIVISRRKEKKAGSEDAEAQWSKARLAFAKQLLEQVELGGESKEPLDPSETGTAKFPPLYLHAIAWWDEHHRKIILGHTSEREARIYRHPTTGKVALPSDGGVLSPEKPNTAVKFPTEARLLFGAAMVQDASGRYGGVKATPFSYTNCQVIGFSAYRTACDAMILRCKHFKRGAYDMKERYGDRLDEELRLRLRKDGKVCVKELIDHVIAESTRLYAGTPFANTFSIFHDGLTAWWEKEAQEYIAERGFKHRQLRCLPGTNDNTRYAGKLPGNSPEICRALDSFGFAHLQRSWKVHTSLTSILDPKDNRRFNMGTVEEVERTLRRCWEVSPTSGQIVTDIQALPRVLQTIIEAKGCIVPDLSLRSGRRAGPDGGPGEGKRARAAIATNTDLVLHADCQPALARLAAVHLTILDACEDDADMAAYVHGPDNEAMLPACAKGK